MLEWIRNLFNWSTSSVESPVTQSEITPPVEETNLHVVVDTFISLDWQFPSGYSKLIQDWEPESKRIRIGFIEQFFQRLAGLIVLSLNKEAGRNIIRKLNYVFRELVNEVMLEAHNVVVDNKVLTYNINQTSCRIDSIFGSVTLTFFKDCNEHIFTLSEADQNEMFTAMVGLYASTLLHMHILITEDDTKSDMAFTNLMAFSQQMDELIADNYAASTGMPELGDAVKQLLRGEIVPEVHLKKKD